MDYDIIVIGAGPGGYPAAIRAAQRGAKTAIVEKEWLGGTCLNCGCIPAKTLIAGSHRYHDVETADKLGVKVSGVEIDYAALVAHKDKTIKTLTGGIGSLLKANGVDLYEGTGSFETANKIRVDLNGGGEEHLTGEKVIIATGSNSIMPGFLPESDRVVDSRAFMERTELPESLIVLGGGYIGCELACMAARLGVKVTIVELLEDILTTIDKDLRKVVIRHMKKELGIEILTGAPLAEVTADKNGVRGKAGEREVGADMLLASVGRHPVTEGLKLEAIGIAPDEKGFIPVDEFSRTTARGVYAIGDVSNPIQLAHAATDQALAAVDHALGDPESRRERCIPYAMFTNPEVSGVGLTESEAKEKGYEVRTGTFQFRSLGRALAGHESEGFGKLVADAATDQLLGAQCVGSRATDLIGEAATAVRNELTAKAFGRTVHAHPTFAEVWMEAAHDAHGECIHAPPKKR
ncbi:dihydrolipoyl dehydrogenase [Kiritimatiella glycovorans]|uniref:Dihydrolipoyl dehydrogenase n=1 Tax=Kiritimatiella glycovorans TaxID=1307763 RepID=A0A0G3EDZ6_9BACT|nr:dihydrolipoyl dehydrogenase [Kiritimatiella glycovorans]AKJ64681.1 Dihydrolipoyl dehydrogenase [Kiritimatiella glycovorans]